ncbi:MAG: hypothetical protein ACE37H_10425 [Phycisphaeraceae bacterium]
MRIMIDSLIGLMLVAVVVAVVMLHHERRAGEQSVAEVQNALQRLHDQAAYHSALQSAMAGQETLLVHMHDAWFGQDVPVNELVSEDRPWIDLAPPGDAGVHPPDPIATDPKQAGFWYNPTTGVFRARVAPAGSEAETLALYNRVNGTSLEAFEQIPDPARRPIAHEPGTTPARQYASMANLTWSEPDPPAAEKTERAFAPLIDPVQKNELIETRKDLAKHREPSADDIANATQAGKTHEQAGGEPAEPGDRADEALADAPPPRPTLEK